jgi:lipoprotein-releasing system permease protein
VPFAWFVALRYLRDGKSQTALILAAVSVGVAVVVFLSALIGGLQISLVDKTLGSQAHVTLQVPREAPRVLVEEGPGRAIGRKIQPASQRLRSIDGWPAVLAALDGDPEVVSASPMVLGAGFAMRADAKEAIFIQGVEPERFLGIIDLRKSMVSGRFDILGGQVVLGTTLAEDLDVGVGDKLRITSTEGIDDVVTVAGLFTLGNEGVDKTWLVTSLRHAQSLYALPGGVTTIEIKVGDVFDAERVALALHDRTGLEANSWMKRNAQLLAGLSAQSNSKALIQFFVVVAVALGIASVLAVSVVQKTREIGILRAVGTASRRVLAIFLIQGGVLGLAGALLGSGLGMLLAKLFENLARGPDGAPQFPVVLEPSLFGMSIGLATAVGILAAVIPARRASHIDPAMAIHNV